MTVPLTTLARCLLRLGIVGQGRHKAPRTTIDQLNSHVLLNIFDWYRLDNNGTDDDAGDDLDDGWNLERWWYKLIQVCRLWRTLILAYPTHLNLHLVCTHGTPVEAMLTHSPPFPLVVYYPGKRGDSAAAAEDDDKRGALFALRQRERVRRVHIATCLRELVEAMDDEYPILKTLVIRSPMTTAEHRPAAASTTVTLHQKLRAPLLRHLTLSNIGLPTTSSRLLSTSTELVSIGLLNYPASGRTGTGTSFHSAEHLISQLTPLSHLEMLTIHFATPVPAPASAVGGGGRPTRRTTTTRVTLPRLRLLAFRGNSEYLEYVLAHLATPCLRTLNIEFFNQLTFDLPSLCQFFRTTTTTTTTTTDNETDVLTFRSAAVHFDKDFVSLIVDPHHKRNINNNNNSSNGSTMTTTHPLHVQISCKPLDWQASGISQICTALSPLLSQRTESLTLGYHKDGEPSFASTEDVDVDAALWRALLRTFGAGVKTLELAGGLVGDLFRALQVQEEEGEGEGEDILPALQELVPLGWGHTEDAFTSFVSAREVAGRPVRLVRDRS